MRIAGIARPGAIYDASAEAQTSESVVGFREDKCDFEENVTDAVSGSLVKSHKSSGEADFPHVTRFGESGNQKR